MGLCCSPCMGLTTGPIFAQIIIFQFYPRQYIYIYKDTELPTKGEQGNNQVI